MTDSIELPGVHVERRTLLQLPLLAAFPMLAARRPPLNADDSEGALEFEAFTKRCGELAAAHLEGGRIDPDVYLQRIATLGARLDGASVPRAAEKPWADFDPPIRVAPVHRALPVMVIQWRLDPNAVLPPHNHTPGYVFSLCLEGECWVRHFEVDGESPALGAEGSFQLRKTMAKLLRPGHGSSLTPTRDNIHTFVAGPDGATGIDVNTFLPGAGDWSMLAYEEGKREGFEKRYEARWIGKPGG